MSKRSREEKALFRGEMLAVQREQTAVLRRIAAVLEKDSVVKVVEEEPRCDGKSAAHRVELDAAKGAGNTA